MVFRVLVIILLLGLIGAVLFQNKREIDAGIALAELKVEAWPIVVEEVKLLTYQEKVELSGVLSPLDELKIYASSSGTVTKLYKKEGDKVKSGEVVARLNEALLTHEINLSGSSLAQAKEDLIRMRNLSAGEAVTAQQLEQAELRVKSEEARNRSLKTRIADTYLRAAKTGTITSLSFKKGEVIAMGHPLGTISDLSKLIARVSLTSSQVLNLGIDQMVDLRADEYPQILFNGNITKIATRADDGLKFNVEVTLNSNEDYPLLAGMFITTVIKEKEKSSFLVDRNAILGGLRDSYVYVAANGSAEKRKVTLGKTTTFGVEVVSGLEAGERLVVSGHRNLKDGVKVKVVSN